VLFLVEPFVKSLFFERQVISLGNPYKILHNITSQNNKKGKVITTLPK
jgi:hypothetical protein